MPRKLRIAASIFFALFAIALCVLWMRSYSTADRLQSPIWGKRSMIFASKEGRLTTALFVWKRRSDFVPGYFTGPVAKPSSFPVGLASNGYFPPFGWTTSPQYFAYSDRYGLFYTPASFTTTLEGGGPVIPHWILAFLCAATSVAVGWAVKPTRFSLRTLLLATTLVAVLLGMGVWTAS